MNTHQRSEDLVEYGDFFKSPQNCPHKLAYNYNYTQTRPQGAFP